MPIPCIFELGNHVAGITNGNIRKDRAKRIYETIESSISECIPWNITPSTGTKALAEHWKSFANEYVIQEIGLTDAFTIQEAKRLKNKYRKSKSKVHIWTKDSALKAWEPDPEDSPFAG